MTATATKPLPPLPTALKTLRSAPVKLDASAKPATNAAKLPAAALKLVCRTKEPIDLGWVRLAHDFASFKAPEITACDHLHYHDDIIGNCSKYREEDGAIVCDAVIESLAAGDTADKIIGRLSSERAPVPYQASIEWDGSISFLQEGKQLVNGIEVQAPAYIVTDWTIKQMAVCPQGADSSTSTELLSRLSAEAAAADATEKKPDETTETTESSATGEEAAPTPAGEHTPPPAGSDTLSRSELKKFSERFGALALEYVADGLSYAAALEKHFDKLSADLVAANAKITELETKLAKPPTTPSRGEREPLSATPASTSTASAQAHLGENISRLANSPAFKVPQASRN